MFISWGKKNKQIPQTKVRLPSANETIEDPLERILFLENVSADGLEQASSSLFKNFLLPK